MAARNVLVKDLHGVETLGAITLLATDKTGTLTQNRMGVSEVWMNSVLYGVMSAPAEETTRRNFEFALTPNAQRLVEICALCTKCRRGFLEDSADPKTPHSEEDAPTPIQQKVEPPGALDGVKDNIDDAAPKAEIFGDATEVGLFKFALECEPELEEKIVAAHPMVWEIPFTSHNKWHLTVHRYDHKDGFFMAMLKGAPERVAARCTHLLNGTLQLPWNDMAQADFEAAYVQMATQGRRVLGLAFLALPSSFFPEGCTWDPSQVDALRSFLLNPTSTHPKQPEAHTSTDASSVANISPPSTSSFGFTLMGLVALMDPPKTGVRHAISALRMAGIQVVMVTGDHPITAEVCFGIYHAA